MQALLDWGASVFTPEEPGLSLTLPVRGLSGLALFLLLWAMGPWAAGCRWCRKPAGRSLAGDWWVLLYLGYIAAMIAHMIFSFFSMNTILWVICGVSLAVGGVASVGCIASAALLR